MNHKYVETVDDPAQKTIRSTLLDIIEDQEKHNSAVAKDWSFKIAEIDWATVCFNQCLY